MSVSATSISVKSSRLEWNSRTGFVAAFCILAVAVRLFFWLYTHRIWEDFLITLNPAQNLWAGHGLTHHAPEPRVYSFTSTLSILILIIGEGFHRAIDLNRVLSLAAAVATIVYAARLMDRLAVHRVAQAACLAYLAADHLQVFFGMAGMETQIATAVALGAVVYAAEDRLVPFGTFAGLALLARPDMLLLDGMCFLFVLARHGRRTLLPAAICAAIVAPWLAFATLYYGSPVPETITVKSYMAGQPELADVRDYAASVWRQFAPFREFWFVEAAPVPDAALQAVVGATLACALLGLAARRPEPRTRFLVAGVVAVFAAYLLKNTVNPYFMWYAPPFTALYFVLVAAGLSAICRRSLVLGSILSAALAVSYAAPIAFAAPLDRQVQRDVDEAVRTEVGRTLNRLMGPNDSVFLEPLGYIGIEIKDRMIYDYPGLGSKIAFAAVKEKGWDAVDALDPDFIVFRPDDFDEARASMPALLPRYEQVAHVVGPTGGSIGFGGLRYGVADNDFTVLRRRRPSP